MRFLAFFLVFTIGLSTAHAQVFDLKGAVQETVANITSQPFDRLSLLFEADRNESAPGTPILFFLTIRNEGNTHRTVGASVTADRALELLQVPGGGEVHGDHLTWSNLPIHPGSQITLTFVAALRISAKAQQRVGISATVEDQSARAELFVQGNPYVTSFGDPVIHWNNVALDAVAEDHSNTFGAPEQMGPNAVARALAIVHAAIYEALNSIDRTHQPYIALIPYRASFVRVSPDAAVAAAAFDSLSWLYPNQRGQFQTAYNNHLAQIPDGLGKTFGVYLGRAASLQIISARTGDGSERQFDHIPSDAPGRHRKDPLNPDQPFLNPKWGEVRPFAMNNARNFFAQPPPSISSPEYADAFNEVKRLGGDGVTTPTDRTREQTEIGLYWAYDGTNKMGPPLRLYNQIAQVIAEDRGNTMVENARLFALMNIAQADGGIAAWGAKYRDDYWRPIVAIREADAGTGPTGQGDDNPLTEGNADWTPLGAPNSNQTNALNFTPPFPAYPSGHATFGSAAFRTIALFYGTDEISFTFMSEEMNGHTTDNRGNVRPAVTRSFSRLSDAILENALSRIYLGIHWRFDATGGIESGTRIAEYVFENKLRPIQ
ncbi:phosphatase PAP2 family protein [Candidatus Peregrinibacteria bacterium]|nr:phosphatase PAP2 family protein [Candidatus Peregrinibacteria bacterium]